MRSRVCLILSLALQFLPLARTSAACQSFADPDGQRMMRSSLASPGTGMEPADVPSDGVTVTFSEEGGYGILAGGSLDAFAADFLNLTPETLPKHVATLFRAADLSGHPLGEVKQVPEAWSALLGSLLLLLLILRRRS